MRGAPWVLLIYVHAAVATNPRSVNLALETTFEFNEKKDVNFIKNMRKFFDKVENNIEKKLNERERSEGYRFTDFLQEIIAVFNAYEDDEFRSVFKELYHVINNQRKGGAEFNDIMNNALRPALLDVIRRSTEIPTRLLKDRLKRISLILSKTDQSHASFVNFLNLLYKGKSPMTLKRIIKGFKQLRKRPSPESQLRQLVRNAVEYLVYEHYAGLDASVKRDVHKWLRSAMNRDTNLMYRQTLKPKTTSNHYLKEHRHSFVTLYPEPIQRYKKGRDQVTAWKRVTLKNQGRFMLVRGDRRSNVGNASGESEESSWSSREKPLAKKTLKSIYRKANKRTDLKDTSSTNLDSVYRSDANKSTLLEAKNTTQSNNSVSQIYLDRLKVLEDQLKTMKRELKARMLLPEITAIQTEIEYDNMDTGKQGLETETNKALDAADKNKNATGMVQTQFRTSLGNKSLILGDSQLSTELKEFLRKKPQILNVAVTNSPHGPPGLNDTSTNSTKEENLVMRSKDVTESSTNVGGNTTNLVDTPQENGNVTTVTTELVINTNATTLGDLATNATSKTEFMNNTVIL